MTRVKRGVTAKKRHKKILEQAKGYYGARSKQFRTAKQAVIKANQYSYRDRKIKKRLQRRLWIIKINACTRQHGLSYNIFINKLKQCNLKINRKNLVELINNNLFNTFISKIIKTDV